MSEQNLRVGLIGAGTMGKNHARVVRDIDGGDLVVVADPDGAAMGVADGVDVVRGFEEALNYDLDCAIVAVPTSFHEEVALQLAAKRIPSLIEKPLAISSQSGGRVLSAFEESDTFAMVGHIERFNPAILEMRRRLSAGELGKLFQISTRRQSSYPRRISDVGVALDLATHDVDLTMHLAGATYMQISAFTSNVSGGNLEDIVVASGVMDNQILVNHIVNWASPLKDRSVSIIGEGGTFIADTATGDLVHHKNGEFEITWDSLTKFRGVSQGESIHFSYERKEPLRAELEAFFGAVKYGKASDCPTLRDGLEAIRVVETIVGSAATPETKPRTTEISF